MIVRSPKYLAGSRGAPCAFRIGGVCTGDADTTVPGHITDRHYGRSQKASDLSVGDICFACHEVFDGRAKMPGGYLITDAEWRFYALRALQDTLERRVELGLLTVAGFDPHAAPKPTKRRSKFKSGRKLQTGKRLEGRSTFQTGRKLSTRKEP